MRRAGVLAGAADAGNPCARSVIKTSSTGGIFGFVLTENATESDVLNGKILQRSCA